MATLKTRERRHANIKKGWDAFVPEFKIMDYDLSLIKTCNFFANEVDDKIKQELTISYWKSLNKNVVGLAKLDDGYFSQTGPLVYLLSKNVDLEEKHVLYLEKKYEQHMSLVQSKAKGEERARVETPDPVVAKPSVQDSIVQTARRLGAEIDYAVDCFTRTGAEFNFKEFLKKNEASAPVVKKLAEFYTPHLQELEETASGSDEQLVEAYSHLSKRQLNKYIAFMKSILEACELSVRTAKITRKPRKTKAKPPGVIIAKLKYMKEHVDLGLKSEMPTKIIGATEVWLFNTKYRKLSQYVALEGMTITVKGTTLMNWCPEKSGGKTIRKPEILKDVASMTKRPLTKMYNDIRGSVAKVNGRMNDETLILRVF